MKTSCSLSLAGLEVLVQALSAFTDDEAWKTDPELVACAKFMELATHQREVAGVMRDRIEELMGALGDVLDAPQLELPKDPPGLVVSIVVVAPSPVGPVVVPGVELEGMTADQRDRAMARWLFSTEPEKS